MNSFATTIFDFVRWLPVRGKFRALTGFLPPSGKINAIVNGAYMQLELGDVIQRTIYLGSFEMPETRWVRRVLRRGDVAVDVGANVGYYTTLLSRIVGSSGHVVSVEANPELCSRLAGVLRENAIDNVDIISAGASDELGETTLFVPRCAHYLYNATMARVAGSEEVRVPLVRLEDELPRLNVSRIRLMKMDVEGHEMRALRGMEALLREGKVEYLLIELNDYWLRQQGSSAQELAAFCEEVGFSELVHGAVPEEGNSADVLFHHTVR